MNPIDDEMATEARKFAEELEMMHFTAPDEETVRVPLGTLRRAANLLNTVLDAAIEQSENARAAHNAVTVADRMLREKDGATQ
jgi:hypothetical protein